MLTIVMGWSLLYRGFLRYKYSFEVKAVSLENQKPHRTKPLTKPWFEVKTLKEFNATGRTVTVDFQRLQRSGWPTPKVLRGV